MASPGQRTAYHHGDLRHRLLEVSRELIETDGPHSFSMAEASRRAGVSVAAPYRHFATREDLLAEVAAQGYLVLAERFATSMAKHGSAQAQLAAAAEQYVLFTLENSGMFDLMFSAGLDKKEHAVLRDAAQVPFAELRRAAGQLVPAEGSDPDRTTRGAELAMAVSIIANGYATALREGYLARDPHLVARRAGAAVRALLHGRHLLTL